MTPIEGTVLWASELPCGLGCEQGHVWVPDTLLRIASPRYEMPPTHDQPGNSLALWILAPHTQKLLSHSTSSSHLKCPLSVPKRSQDPHFLLDERCPCQLPKTSAIQPPSPSTARSDQSLVFILLLLQYFFFIFN